MTEQRVGIRGLVTIKQDDEIVYEEVPNHWINAGLRGLTSFMCGTCFAAAASTTRQSCWSNDANIKVGMDTTTATIFSMTDLVNANTNSPNGFSATNVLNPTVGNWKITYTGTWAAGIITGAIGEIGLYLAPFTLLTYGWTETNVSKPQALVARISSADGTFVAFVPDQEKVLTVEWSVAISMV